MKALITSPLQRCMRRFTTWQQNVRKPVARPVERCCVGFMEILGQLPVSTSSVASRTCLDLIVVVIPYIEDDLGRDDFLAFVVGFAAFHKSAGLIDCELSFELLVAGKVTPDLSKSALRLKPMTGWPSRTRKGCQRGVA